MATASSVKAGMATAARATRIVSVSIVLFLVTGQVPRVWFGAGRPVPAMRRSRQALAAFAIREQACGAHNQLHDLVDIFLYTLKFSARQIELSIGSRNLSVRSDGSHLFDVDVNQNSRQVQSI